MQTSALWIGRLLGLAGIAMTAAAAATRLGGSYTLGTFEAITVLNGGVAVMVAACLAYLIALAEGPHRR